MIISAPDYGQIFSDPHTPPIMQLLYQGLDNRTISVLGIVTWRYVVRVAPDVAGVLPVSRVSRSQRARGHYKPVTLRRKLNLQKSKKI